MCSCWNGEVEDKSDWFVTVAGEVVVDDGTKDGPWRTSIDFIFFFNFNA